MERDELQARVDQLQSVCQHLQQMVFNMDKTITPEGRIKAVATMLRVGLAAIEGRANPEQIERIEAKLRDVSVPILLAAIASQKLQNLQWQLNSGDLETIEQDEAVALAETSVRNAIVAQTF